MQPPLQRLLNAITDGYIRNADEASSYGNFSLNNITRRDHGHE